ncbi:MAG: PAS domain S-box protein [Desulfomonilaceae bacterium]
MILAELEILKSVVFCVLTVYLWRLGVRAHLRDQRGWSYMLIGFAVILSALVLGVTESFPSLSTFFVIGNTSYERLLRDGVLFPLGFIFVTVGAGKLLPFINRLAKADAKLRKTLSELEDRVRERTTDLVAANDQLQTEVDERRSVEVELRQSEEKYRLIFEHSPLGVFHFDETGTITACNDNFVWITGYSREKLIGLNTIRDIKDEKVIAAIKQALSGAIGHYEDYYSSVTGKKITPVKCEFAPILSQDGGVTGGIGMVEEITDRKKSEEALRESEELFRLAFQTGPDPVTISTLKDGLYVDLNDGFTSFTGYSRDDAVGKSSTELDIWNDPEDRRRLVRTLQEEGHVQNLEAKFRLKDGRVVTGLMSARVFMLKGEPHLLSIVRDIEEWRRTQEALRESEAKYRSLFDNAPVGIFQTSSKGQARYVNPYMAKLVGAESPEEAVTHFTQLSQQLYVDPHRRDEFIKLLMEEGKVTDFEYEAVRIDGTHRCFTMNARASEHLSDGSFLIDGFTSDITERKQAEEALRQSEERYRAIFNNAAAGISLTDREGRFLAVNSTSARIYGYTQEELLGLTFYDLTHPEDVDPSRRELLPLQQGQKDSYRLEKRYVRKDGKVIWAELSVSALCDARGEYAATLAVVVDITERKKSEQERESLQRQLLQAQKMEAIGTLAGGIAHDFNNLLQVILGYAEILLMKKESKDPDRKKMEVIQHAARDGADLVARILTFSRKGESRARPMDLNDEIRRVEKLLRRTLPKMIQIDLLLADDLRIIEADPAQIEQVILNLGVNAQHALPEGGRLTIQTSNVSLSDEWVNTHLDAKPGEYVLLTISDTGMGIPPEVLDRIFEPFFTTKANGEGTGLGLAMVHGIVAQHGGYIRCYSELGMGTSFKIYFPASSTELLSDLAVTGEMPAFGSETVLLVDDDDRVREITRQIIEMGGYKVLVARSGEEALVKCRGRKDEISLVILDLIMPGIGGKECLRELRQIQPKLKVLVASGFSDAASVQESIEMGANGFIYKPFNSKELLRQVRRVLDEASTA